MCTMVEGAAVPFETSMIDITGTDTQATLLISRVGVGEGGNNQTAKLSLVELD